VAVHGGGVGLVPVLCLVSPNRRLHWPAFRRRPLPQLDYHN
jgi:hypothetical protein